MRLHDVISGFFFMALGLAVLLMARNFPQMPGQEIGPSTFPTLIGTCMMLGGAIVAAISLRRLRKSALVTLDPGWRHPLHLASVGFCLLGTLVLSIWFEEIGFPLAALVMCTGMYLLSGLRKPLVFVMAAGFVAIVAFVMTRMLYVPLPMGSWL